MKFNSKLDSGIAALTLASVALNMLLLLCHVFKLANTIYIAVFISLINVLVVLPLICKTEYTLTQDSVVIRAAFLKKAVKYSALVSVSTASGHLPPAPALSAYRLCLRYEDKGRIKSIFVSPTKRKIFILRLCEAVQSFSTPSLAKNDAEG